MKKQYVQETEKNLKIVEEFLHYIKIQDPLTSKSETSENANLFVNFIYILASFGVFIYIKYFFDVENNKLQTVNFF